MSNRLNERFRKKNASAATEARSDLLDDDGFEQEQDDDVEEREGAQEENDSPSMTAEAGELTYEVMNHCEVEVEAVVKGALMKVFFRGDVNPAEIPDRLRALDPGVKFRDDFPKRGGGPKETKAARCLVANLRVSGSGMFIDLTCEGADDDVSVSVPKSKSESFVGDLRGLGRIHDSNIEKLEKAIEAKGSATVILREDEQFGVKYWSTDDGKHFLDSLMAEPPARVDGNGGKGGSGDGD